ncbi:hypothetical protein [Peredibacter starrii]|uniref:HEPN domain-containing protein n=1 Tax=Peredibacter starrii TaxID=28202 RepID=A0AAX4HUE2_9BACT|nr:hypothetical protein [Peredibacter starrii]WPU66762.1 hypothetical protein SOO65_08380 [Peredibacter starrii]
MDELQRQMHFAQLFCKEGTKYLLNSDVNSDHLYCAVVFLQTSFELLVRNQHLNKSGPGISNTKKDAILKGSLKELRDEILKDHGDTQSHELVFSSLHKLRNKILHEGNSLNSQIPDLVANTCLLLIYGFSSVLKYHNHQSDSRPSILKKFLGEDLFLKLINFEVYKEKIQESLDNEDSLTSCAFCSQQTVVANSGNDSYDCHLCGFELLDFVGSYCECPNCKEPEGFLYEKLNPGIYGQSNGKCWNCDLISELIQCEWCGEKYFISNESEELLSKLELNFSKTNTPKCPACFELDA